MCQCVMIEVSIMTILSILKHILEPNTLHACLALLAPFSMAILLVYSIPNCLNYCRRVLILANFSDFMFIAKFCPRF